MFQAISGRFQDVSRVFQTIFKEVSSVYLGSFEGVSREFKWCLKSVLRKFYNFVFARQSSQLPELVPGSSHYLVPI